jgi:23S rRNA A2030 N6-methylase RlmJ
MTQEFGGGCGRIEIEIDPLYKRKEYEKGIMRLVEGLGIACLFREQPETIQACRDQIRVRIEELR